MEPHDLVPLVEALLFAADEPMTVRALTRAVGEEGVTGIEVKRALEALAAAYDFQERGFRLVRLGNGYQVLTRDRYAPWVEAMVAGKRRSRLSRAALETAAVIAYKQPITRLEIERIRGVDAGGVLHTLMERNLIMIKGRDPGPGRPLLYGTTQAFLDYFGLSSLSELPALDEIAALAQGAERSSWDETERARFEKHGVEPEEIPPPGGEEDSAEADEGMETDDREEADTTPEEAPASTEPGTPRPEY